MRISSITRIAFVVVLAGNGSAFQSISPAAGAGWRTFRDSALGFSFAYPPDWVVAAGCHGSRRCIGVSEAKRGVDDYTLALEVFVGGLEQIAINKSVFRPRSGGWIANGRSSNHPVDLIAGTGWRGLQSVVDCGTSDRSGAHPAAGECLWAVLSNGRISVVADTQGERPITDQVHRVIRSLRFVGQ